MTTRREFMTGAATVAALSAVAGRSGVAAAAPTVSELALAAPEKGNITVAFALNDGATVIDFAGPWEVFQDVHVPDRGATHEDQMPFELYTVSPDGEPLRATGGMRIIPDYTVTDAPQPHIVVVPAQRTHDRMLEWLEAVSGDTDVTMSVCTGAFQLGRAGLLDGLTATTHHDFYDDFAEAFPRVRVERGLRFVEHERISTAGGLTSGIDLALRVVARYFGEPVAAHTAEYMEYTSDGWRQPVVGA